MPDRKQQTPVTIVIADDNKAFRDNLVLSLEDDGKFKVLFSAPNGQAFLDKLRHSNEIPRIALIDVDMPIMNGIETVFAAKNLNPIVDFVMLTVFDDENRLFDAIKAGASGYLLKGTTIAQIKQALLEVVEVGGSPMSPSIARKAFNLLQNTSAKKNTTPRDFDLSEREVEVLGRLVKGETYTQIADVLFLSPHTIRKHIANVYAKLHVCSKAEAVAIATRRNWFFF